MVYKSPRVLIYWVEYISSWLPPTYSRTELVITWLTYPSSYDLTSSIILTSSCNSCRSYLNNWYTCITRSVTLSPPSLALSLKILSIFRLFTKGVVSFDLICCYLSLMPPSVTSICHTALIALILSIGKVMPSCSCCIKKGLVYIAIISLFNC